MSDDPYKREYQFTSEDRRRRYLEKHGIPEGLLSRPFHRNPSEDQATSYQGTQGNSIQSAGPSLFRSPIFTFPGVPFDGKQGDGGRRGEFPRQESDEVESEVVVESEPVRMAVPGDETQAGYFPGSPPLLSGLSSDNPRSWFSFYELVAASKKWDGETKALNLPLYLRNEALEAYIQLTPEQKGNYEAAKQALLLALCPQENERLVASQLHSVKQQAGETVRQFHRRVSNLSTQAYPGLETATLDRLVLDFFTNGLRSDLQFPFLTSSPRTMKEALSIASRAEASLELFPSALTRFGGGDGSKKSGGKIQAVSVEKDDVIWRELDLINARLDLLQNQLVNQGDYSRESQVMGIGSSRQRGRGGYSKYEVGHVMASSQGQRGGPGPCYSCGEFGHIARHCPFHYQCYPPWSDPQISNQPKECKQGEGTKSNRNSQSREEQGGDIMSGLVNCDNDTEAPEIFIRCLSTSSIESQRESDGSGSSSICSIPTTESEATEVNVGMNLEIEKEYEMRRSAVDAAVQVQTLRTPTTTHSRSTSTQTPTLIGITKEESKSSMMESSSEEDDVSRSQVQTRNWDGFWKEMSFYCCFLLFLWLLLQNPISYQRGFISNPVFEAENASSTSPYSVCGGSIKPVNQSITIGSQILKWDVLGWDIALSNRRYLYTY